MTLAMSAVNTNADRISAQFPLLWIAATKLSISNFIRYTDAAGRRPCKTSRTVQSVVQRGAAFQMSRKVRGQ